MPRFVYRSDGKGNIKAIPLAGRIPARGTPDDATKPFQQTVLDAYNDADSQGMFRGKGINKTMVRRIHENALAEDMRR